MLHSEAPSFGGGWGRLLITFSMTLTQLILLAIIGLMAGIFSGTLGVGGAIIVIPALIFFMGLSQHQAQGTSLAFMIPPVTL
ncbi:MAG: TSUP family transporter, partial [Bacteroidota bacterium]|nr:TSUP family transporter [Bacteroidota bacterium]